MSSNTFTQGDTGVSLRGLASTGTNARDSTIGSNVDGGFEVSTDSGCVLEDGINVSLGSGVGGNANSVNSGVAVNSAEFSVSVESVFGSTGVCFTSGNVGVKGLKMLMAQYLWVKIRA